MKDRTTIHAYLKSLSKYLSRLEQADAAEVIKEIECHVYDVIESKEAQGETVEVNQILSGFGSPRDLAAQYVEHVLTGTPPPTGFNRIQKLKRGVTKGIWYSMAIFGYGVSGFLVLAGIMKILYPDQVGVWLVAEGNSIMITFSEHVYQGSTEQLGWWLIPVLLLAGAMIFWLTKRILTALSASLI